MPLNRNHLASTRHIAPALFAALALGAPLAADARITRIEIDATKSESPTFGGYSWPKVGQYEKVVGKAYGEVNPHDRQNRVIVDIEFAPRNARGNVEYAFNFYILKPIDLSKGADKMMYEPPNRGGKTWSALGRVSGGGDDPGSITDPTVLANSFLMPRGYTIAWSGWEDLGTLDTFNASATFPIARFSPTAANPTGTITGPSYEYIVVGNNTTASVALSYPAATLDKTKATLTHRVHLNDAPEVIPASGWNYNATGTAISLASGNFAANDIYEFAYTAKDPKVNGLGFAAVRDWMEFLRYARRDDYNNPNPLARHIKRVYTEISSQPGRLLNDFRHLGFNETESGKKAFDGHMQWIAAGNGINMNYRFSQSGRTERNRQQHLYIEGRFPFANVTTYDPITRKIDSRYASCQKTNTCPLGMEIYSANEYWVKARRCCTRPRTAPGTSRIRTYTRNYFMSSMRHGTAASPDGPGTLPGRGLCQQARQSAELGAGAACAVHRPGRVGDGGPQTAAQPRAEAAGRHAGAAAAAGRDGLPEHPEPLHGHPVARWSPTPASRPRATTSTTGRHFYETGIATINPPVFPFTTPSYQDDPRNGPIYPSFIPKTDRDGNDIAGVRLVDVTVPLATYTGWALRRGVHANDGCEAAGQFIPFATTEDLRGSDPRRSVAARYPTFAVYHGKVRQALNDMVSDRLLLCEDAGTEETRLMQAGLNRGVPKPTGGALPAVQPLPACQPHKGGHGHHHDRDDDDKRRD